MLYDYAELLFSFEGRIPRSVFWLKYIIPVWVLLIISILLDNYLGTSVKRGDPGVICLIILLLNFFPSIVVNVKRCHDRGRTGWFILVMLVPLLNIWPIIELYFLRGTEGPNQYGSDPLAPEKPQRAAIL